MARLACPILDVIEFVLWWTSFSLNAYDIVRRKEGNIVSSIEERMQNIKSVYKPNNLDIADDFLKKKTT